MVAIVRMPRTVKGVRDCDVGLKQPRIFHLDLVIRNGVDVGILLASTIAKGRNKLTSEDSSPAT